MITKIYRPELEGKNVYPLWRLDKNISWSNIITKFFSIIYGLLTLEWLRQKCGFMLWRFKPFKVWLPVRYVKGYYVEREV